MRGEVMGVSAEYDADAKRRRTHFLLVPKVESERISVIDGEVLDKVAILVSTRPPAKSPKKGILQGDGSRSILLQVRPTAKQGSVLEVDKYAPDENSKWKRVSARFPALYKALLVEPDVVTCGAMLKSASRAAG